MSRQRSGLDGSDARCVTPREILVDGSVVLDELPGVAFERDDLLRRAAHRDGLRRDYGARRDGGPGGDQGSLADPGTVEHGGPVADQGLLADRAVVHQALVADGGVPADLADTVVDV